MSRELHPATSAAVGEDVVYEGWFIRLDILGDPVIIWTGLQDKAFGPGQADAALNNLTFAGMGQLSGLGSIVDGRGGSQAVQLRLPGVDLNDEALRQVVFNKATWQRRQAWIWYATLDSNYNVVGELVRVKTGRMDKMVVRQDARQSFVQVTIESHQAYAGEVLNTKYSEQKEIDSTDVSQSYVHALANMQPVVGGATAGNAQAVNAVAGFVSGGNSAIGGGVSRAIMNQL